MGSALYDTFSKLIVDDKIIATDDDVVVMGGSFMLLGPGQASAARLSHDELQAQTLRHVNQLRMRQGRDALYELPPGRPGNWADCVLGRALGACAGDAVRGDAVLMEFVRRFDRSEFPKLVDVEGMLEHAGINVAVGDTVTVESPLGKVTFMSGGGPDGAQFVPAPEYPAFKQWVAPAPILEAEPV